MRKVAKGATPRRAMVGGGGEGGVGGWVGGGCSKSRVAIPMSVVAREVKLGCLARSYLMERNSWAIACD